MSVDVFLYVPRMIINVMREFVFDFGFMSFSAFDLFTMVLLVSIVVAAIRRFIYD